MEALVFLLIAVIAASILLVIVRHSRDEADKMQKEKEPGIKITVNHPKVPRLICPRCGEQCREPFLRVSDGEIVCLDCAEKS